MQEAEVAERVHELVATLNALDFGLDANAGGTAITPAEGVDAAIVVKGTRLLVEVRRDVRDADVRALLAELPAHFVVVADRLSPGAKVLLERHHAGWFDRRGELRVELPGAGLLLKTPVPAVVAPERGRATNPFTATGLDVAIALLLAPTEPLAVREIARRTDNSHGRVSEILTELRARALVDRDGTPAIPELFDAAAAAWRPHWVPLGARPRPDSSLRLSGSIGAVWRKVPIIVAEQWPPEVYVRDQLALRRLVTTYPPDTASTIAPPARAAVCPSPYGFDRPLDLNPDFPVANYLVVALDLAQDEGRGREALDAWNPEAFPVSGEVLLSDEGGLATRLVGALAELTARVEPGTFALVGGLAVMARLRQVHRATEDIDGVSQQVGDHPSAVAVVLGESSPGTTPQPIAGVKIDHIDVGSVPTTEIPASGLPDDDWDRAFVLAHRWGLDAATPATLSAVRRGEMRSSVTCLVASPASLVTMKLQSAPRRPPARFHKSANDYLDLFRFLSDVELAPEIATDLVHGAPHQLGRWAIERIRIEMSDGADNVARALRRGASQEGIGAADIAGAADAFLDRAWSIDGAAG